MAEVFPDAQVVGIVRHPGAVVASQLRRGIAVPRRAAALAQPERPAAAGRAAARTCGSGIAVLRYEDLVGPTEPVLRELVAFLGEPWSPDLLRHHELAQEQGGTAARRGRHAHRGSRSTAGRDGRWEAELSDAAAARAAAGHGAAARGVPVRRRRRAAAAPAGGKGGRLLLRAATWCAASGAARAGGARPHPVAGAGARPSRRSLATLLRMVRTDPVYVVRRLPVVVRARLHSRSTDGG